MNDLDAGVRAATLPLVGPTCRAVGGAGRQPASDGLLSNVAAGGRLLRTAVAALALVTGSLVTGAAATRAVTPESPEVRAMVEKGLKFLEKEDDERLGGKCLIGLAFYKAGRPKDHPRIQDAVAACRTMAAAEAQVTYIYGKAIAVIFLSEVDPSAYRDLIGQYAGMFNAHRKPSGGFGYAIEVDPLGDTSQTQYAALSFWQLLRAGIRPPVDQVEACANWLLRTQSPEGAWGYKGQDPGNFTPVEQNQISPCMLAAGLGSSLICGNMLGLLTPGGAAVELPAELQASADVPAALRRAEDTRVRALPQLQGTGAVSVDRLKRAKTLGRQWLDKNFEIDNDGRYPFYYLYALERYKSFEAYVDGDATEEPDWYQKGFEYLQKNQNADGSWYIAGESSGKACSTAFAVLFLLRSTQQSIKASLGEGTLVGGRGLPRDLSRVRLRGGKLVVEQQPTEVDQFLDLLSDNDGAALDALLADPAALRVDKVSGDEVRRLQQIVRSGPPEARLLAVRALSQLRNLDFVPTLIYALTDPDQRVVREARDGLRLVSRRFQGFGLPDNVDDPRQRDVVIEKWKAWYRSVRPDAPPIP